MSEYTRTIRVEPRGSGKTVRALSDAFSKASQPGAKVVVIAGHLDMDVIEEFTKQALSEGIFAFRSFSTNPDKVECTHPDGRSLVIYSDAVASQYQMYFRGMTATDIIIDDVELLEDEYQYLSLILTPGGTITLVGGSLSANMLLELNRGTDDMLVDIRIM